MCVCVCVSVCVLSVASEFSSSLVHPFLQVSSHLSVLSVPAFLVM